MALAQPATRKYLRKLYKFLETRPTFAFRRLRGYRGYIYGFDTKTDVEVNLDPRDKILSTLLHEFIHYVHPDWCESDVLRMEFSFVNSLTDRQVRTIIKRFAEAL